MCVIKSNIYDECGYQRTSTAKVSVKVNSHSYEVIPEVRRGDTFVQMWTLSRGKANEPRLVQTWTHLYMRRTYLSLYMLDANTEFAH